MSDTLFFRPELNELDRSTALTDTFGEKDTRKPRIELREVATPPPRA